jgi:hypothetical protein
MVFTDGPKSIGPGLIGDVLGGSVGSGLEEAPVGLELRATQVGEVGAPPTPGESCAPSGLQRLLHSLLNVGSRGLGHLRGLTTHRALLVEESRLIS